MPRRDVEKAGAVLAGVLSARQLGFVEGLVVAEVRVMGRRDGVAPGPELVDLVAVLRHAQEVAQVSPRRQFRDMADGGGAESVPWSTEMVTQRAGVTARSLQRRAAGDSSCPARRVGDRLVWPPAATMAWLVSRGLLDERAGTGFR